MPDKEVLSAPIAKKTYAVKENDSIPNNQGNSVILFYEGKFRNEANIITSLLWEIRDCLSEYHLSSISNGLNNVYKQFGVRNDNLKGQSFKKEKEEILRLICEDIQRTHVTEFNLKLFEINQAEKKMNDVEKMLRKNDYIPSANQVKITCAYLNEICEAGKTILDSMSQVYQLTGVPIVQGTGFTVEEIVENIKNG